MRAEAIAARRRRLRERLAGAGLDALLVTGLVNVRYLTGFTGSAGTLLVQRDPEGELLVTDGRYTEQAAGEAPGVARHEARGDGWLPERLGPRVRLGLEAHRVTWARARALGELLPDATMLPAGELVEDLRAEKDDAELAALERACDVTAETLAGVPQWLAPGLRERDVARRIVDELLDRGADGSAFAPIVASGPNSARPHHRPGERALQVGDVVLCDVGALVDGYHADMTRMFALGPPSAPLRRAYAAVRAAQRAGVDAAVTGATAGDVDAACQAPLDAAGFGEHVVHPSGHAVGLEVHEQPILRRGAAGRLRLRMTVTVEPGVYLPGEAGARIEDVVAITEQGPRVLTRASTDLTVL